MLAYQTQYVKNVRQIAALRDLCNVEGLSFADWYQQRQQAEDRLAELRQENLTLLSDHLFARLDDLHNATAEEIAQLEAFADELMDWKTNLDCGVYVLIHDSLLSLYRVRRDRDGIIKELYKLGMGLYYLDRSIQGIRKDRGQALYFENEMVFTEAGSYLKFFEQIENIQIKKELHTILLTRLTENQRRRLLLHVLKGLSERQIADLELVDRRAVHDSIEAARKKIKKFFRIF